MVDAPEFRTSVACGRGTCGLETKVYGLFGGGGRRVGRAKVVSKSEFFEDLRSLEGVGKAYRVLSARDSGESWLAMYRSFR